MEIREDSLFYCFGCGVLIINARGEVTHANEGAESILGNREGWCVVTPGGETLSPRKGLFARILAGEKIVREEVPILRSDARNAVLLLNGTPLCGEGGGIKGGVLDFSDITASKHDLEETRRANSRLQESRNRLDALIGSIDEIVFEFDADGVYLHVWTANDALLKHPREELLGRAVDEVMGPELGVPFLAALRRVSRTGTPESLEYPLEVIGGRRWFLARIAPIPGTDGHPPTLAFLARDISERKKMEEELRASERRFHQFLEHMSLAALILDPRGRIVYCNDFFLELTGWGREEIQGGMWFDIFVPEKKRGAARDRWVEAVCAGRLAGYHEEELVTRHGERRLLGWNSIRLTNGSEKPIGCASIAEDITERRRAEEVLRRSDRMKSEFISTAAHELRTPLTSIMGYAELLLKTEQYGNFPLEDRLDFARQIFEKSELLSGIINGLLDLSRFEAGEPMHLDLVPCRLDEILTEKVERYRESYPRHLIELSLEDTCPEDILIDQRRMEDVLENLLSNAAKYSPPGRCIRVKGRPFNAGYLVTVADEGIGMNDEQVQHVFDKFYRADTSDTSLSGLGIGMSIVRHIIEAHGGRIWISSTPLRGTTVCFYLPSTDKKKAPSRQERGRLGQNGE